MSDASSSTAAEAAPLDIPEKYNSVGGISIFRDIFRRVDRNDDGHITYQEFVDYFQDSSLPVDELKSIFGSMDEDGNETVEINELVEYMLKGFDPYSKVYATMEKLNDDLSECLISTATTYTSLPPHDQFRSRVFMSEMLRQIQAISQPVDAAADVMLKQVQQYVPPTTFVQASHQQQQTLAATISHQSLSYEVDRLREYLNQLQELLPRQQQQQQQQLQAAAGATREEDRRVSQSDANDDTAQVSTGGESCYIVRRVYTAGSEENDGQLSKLIDEYLSEAGQANGAFRINGRKLSDRTYEVTEVWDAKSSVQDMETGAMFQKFGEVSAPLCAGPAAVTTMEAAANLFLARPRGRLD